MRLLLSQRERLKLLQLYSLRERDLHRVKIPRFGGVVFYVAFFIAMQFSLLLFSNSVEDREFLDKTFLILAIALIVGLLDDVLSLHYTYKLLLQLLISFTIVYNFGHINGFIFPGFGYSKLSSPLGIALTIFLLLFILNAINFIDGMDGLAGGVMLIGSVTLYLHSSILFNAFRMHVYLTTLTFYLVLIAILLAFLHYNMPPAKIFMGESGVLFLGVITSILFVDNFQHLHGETLNSLYRFSSQRAFVHKYNTLYVPVLMFLPCIALPSIDLISTVFIRILKGGSPLIADKNHIHHRFIANGYSYKATLYSIYTLTICINLLSLLFSIYSLNRYFLWFSSIILLVATLILYIIKLMMRS
jgi:UDP-GlcNAc:undecaprenyl-phosphate GlcNAc-1-phosphate transferase